MKKNNLIALFLMLCTACFCSCSQQEKTVTFAIASDFHAQDVPDGKERLSSFVRAAQDANADFIIELGDFCRLDSANQVFHDIWNSFPRDKYHTIGNHDMDAYTPDEYVAGMKMPGRYYSFDKGDFHFIVLDGNNLYDGKIHSLFQSQLLCESQDESLRRPGANGMAEKRPGIDR